FKTEAYLVKEVMKFYLSNFIFCEQKRIEKYQVEQIIMLEQKFYDEIKLDDGKTINFSCKIDRVDKLADGRLIVIDYKTGKTPIMNKDIRHIELSRENIKKKIKSFQLPLYVYIVNKQFDNAVVDAMFYNIKEPEKINLLFEDNEKMSREEIMTKIFEALNYITSEILNAEISFYADDADPNQCKFCDYNNLCR
ncbi:MAG: PD-(D/E)XK nuclease family protein, partial [Endomicrobia bacterium]|nr:PD-(D/E)XK nuclease family protein [Endomicrobiia bacterium]